MQTAKGRHRFACQYYTGRVAELSWRLDLFFGIIWMLSSMRSTISSRGDREPPLSALRFCLPLMRLEAVRFSASSTLCSLPSGSGSILDIMDYLGWKCEQNAEDVACCRLAFEGLTLWTAQRRNATAVTMSSSFMALSHQRNSNAAGRWHTCRHINHNCKKHFVV